MFSDLLREDGYRVGIDGRHHHLDGRVKDAPHIVETLEQQNMKNLEDRFDHLGNSKTKAQYLKNVRQNFSLALDAVGTEQPFFLYFGFNQPHRKFGKDHEGIDPAALVLPPDWPDLPEVRLDYARYLAEVRDLDQGFSQIESVLEQRQLMDNTVVIFMGDNGEALLRGKGTLYRRGLHVPLIIRWPHRVKGDTSSDALICGTDLAPTILDMVGIPKPKGMTGMSFLDELLGKGPSTRTMQYAERGWHHGQLTESNGFDLSRSIVTDEYHYVYNALPDRAYQPVDMVKSNIAWEAIKLAHAKGELSPRHAKLYFQNPRPIFELFHIASDPQGLNNLAGKASVAEVEQELRHSMDRWMISESDHLPLPSMIHALLKKRAKR
jgi:arylsulfatase A-like enzyme